MFAPYKLRATLEITSRFETNSDWWNVERHWLLRASDVRASDVRGIKRWKRLVDQGLTHALDCVSTRVQGFHASARVRAYSVRMRVWVFFLSGWSFLNSHPFNTWNFLIRRAGSSENTWNVHLHAPWKWIDESEIPSTCTLSKKKVWIDQYTNLSNIT